MALVQLSLLSQAMGINTNVNILLPDRDPPAEGYRVLYLLHGYMGDCSDWIRQSMLERYMADTHTLVVMPTGGRSFYTDTLSGDNYWSFLSQELPFLMSRYFPISRHREHTFALGLSMGGYGAVKLGLRQPDNIGYVVSFSGVLDVLKLWSESVIQPDLLPNCTVPPSFDNIFGSKEQFKGGENDCIELIRSINSLKCPKISLFCGTGDALLDMNRSFAKLAQQVGLPCTYQEFEGGHDWNFWNIALEKALKDLPLSP